MQRDSLQPETTCRFRVANATIDVIVRTAPGAAPLAVWQVRDLAMVIGERAQALARR
jgi:hypothetical protein